MYQIQDNSTLFRAITLLIALFGFLCAQSTLASGLTLEEAERLALETDYSLQAIDARSQSMSELAIAAEQLPDPKLKFGVVNLPTDSFNLGQEAMTQVLVGLKQEFPRGHTRALSSARVKKGVERNDQEALDRRAQILLAVREQFTEILLQSKRAGILEQSLATFSDLAQITEDYYATGRAQQQDVIQAALELSRVKERLSSIRQRGDQARARLAERIGPVAWNELEQGWPRIEQPKPGHEIIEGLASHPRLRAWQHEIARSETGEEIARQRYKPGFAVDVAYGGRGGTNFDGSSRSDLMSVMVTMDVPLFTSNRQDRVVAARVAETSATRFARDDAYRTLKSQVEFNAAALNRELERLNLYETTLLPQAEFNAEAAYEAYRDAVDDLTTLMRARISEYELRLDHASLESDELKTRARLLYLQGEPS
jgi:outer membrane protein TolC